MKKNIRVNKKKNISIERLGISWIEFYDDKYLNNTKSVFLFNNIKHLRKKSEKICILTGRAYRDRHADILNSLRKKLLDLGIEIYKMYFVSNKLQYKHTEEISLNKVHTLIEHMVGLKIEDGEFKPFKQDWYADVNFYDDEKMNIDYANDVQKIFDRLLKNTEDDLFQVIMDRINKYDITLTNNLITNNEINQFETTKVVLKTPSRFPVKMSDEHIKNFNKFLNEPTK